MIDTQFADFLKKHPAIVQENALAVAVSGGPDSMALAHMALRWAQANNKQLHLLTVDHGLRTEAKAEAEQVAQWAKAQNSDGLYHHILTWHGPHPDAGIMEAARAARYNLMAEYCQAQNIRFLFVAHHQGDQAETFLIRLSKGSGLDGLAGMAELRVYNDVLTLGRPLLGVSKDELMAYCAQYLLPVVQDPSNQNDDYLRPRLRNSIRVLEDEGLSEKRLATTAKRLARARRALEEIADQVFSASLLEKNEAIFRFDYTVLRAQPEEIALRVIQKALETMRPEADYQVRMERLEELFAALWYEAASFKPRTLGGCLFALKDKKTVLLIERENKKEQE